MPLASMTEIIGPARAAGRGVGAFNVIGIEHAEAIVAGAEIAGAPAVLQISENCVAYHGALEPIAGACLALARSAAVPVAVHLDHAASAELVRAAADLGIGSVMFDASSLPYQENVRVTADVAEWCHGRGIWVEAELGEIGGKNGVHSPTGPHRPGRGGRVRRRHRGRRAGGRDRQLARYADPRCGPRPSPHRQHPPCRQRSPRAARLVWRAGPGPGGSRRGRDDQDQHRDPAQQGIYRRRQGLPVGRARGGRSRRYGAAGRDAVASEVARLLDLLSAGSIVQEETVGPRELAVGTDATAGGAGEPLSSVE